MEGQCGGSSLRHMPDDDSDYSVAGTDSEHRCEILFVYRLKLVWNKSEDKTFLGACIHELTTNGREGSGLKASSWKIVREKLMNEHSKEVDQKQMRNHFDYYKSKYVAWVKLKNKTGNIYDPIKNKFNMTDEQWKEEGKLNKHMLSLKTKPLLFPDLCTQLFEGSTSTDFESWGPSSTLPRPVEEFSAHDFDDDVLMETSTQHIGASEESSGRSKHTEIGGNKRVGGKKRDVRALEVEYEIIKLARLLVEKNERIEKREMDKDVDACMEKLNKMEWGEEDERHKTALLLFGESADVRKVWLRLSHTSCESWVMGAGALDGTLVHAVVPVDQQTRYRGRGKGECFQNVIGICDFDLIFTFVWAGWEDKYYLCDAAFTNTRGFMAPYCNTRYWLADFRRGRFLTREERFNYAHAQLRNVIERAYGVLKARFPILKQMAHYPFTVQRDIVIACVAVHNFIRKYNIEDDLFRNFEDTMITPDVQGGGIDRENIQGIEWGPEVVEYMRALRD
ncbi:L10-interacting MYB domain-containing protein-like [Lactuca sativa]|uniref:L10-interacting MYB domain-containing protein-like n=1 Tax=Lactuca sativa TaxID=4236 RepID=UPI0022B001CB|nr:L10-interacting MYB domain-containing protein-like [Lactuca sativa]